MTHPKVTIAIGEALQQLLVADSWEDSIFVVLFSSVHTPGCMSHCSIFVVGLVFVWTLLYTQHCLFALVL